VGTQNLSWNRGFDFSTGLVISFTDPNNHATTYDYSDPLDRPKLITRQDSGRTQFIYDDTQHTITTQADQNSLDARLISEILYDGLGRQSQSRSYEDANIFQNNYISVEQTMMP